MNITPIPEQEAANLIGVSLRTIRNAVDRGALVRIPGTSKVQRVAKEQAELFVGKNRIVLGVLSSIELQAWQKVQQKIMLPSLATQDIDEKIDARVAKMMAVYDNARHDLTEEEKKIILQKLSNFANMEPSNGLAICIGILIAAYGTVWLVKLAKDLWMKYKEEAVEQSTDDKIIEIADRIKNRADSVKEAVPLAIEETYKLVAS